MRKHYTFITTERHLATSTGEDVEKLKSIYSVDADVKQYTGNNRAPLPKVKKCYHMTQQFYSQAYIQ